MSTGAKGTLAGWVFCVAALVVLACCAYTVPEFQHLDSAVLSKLGALGDTPVGSAAELVRATGSPAFFVLFLALVCKLGLKRGHPGDAGAAAIVAVGAVLTTEIIKITLAHPRIQAILGGDQLGPTSFPSGHMTAATSLVLALTFVVPPELRSRTLAVGAAFLAVMGLSLIVVHAHYPSDVAGGFLVACGWGLATFSARDVLQKTGPTRQLRSNFRVP